LLILYGFYLLLIGVNGLVESLRDAVTPHEIIQKQFFFIVFSVISHLGLGKKIVEVVLNVKDFILLSYYGAGGLIVASCLSTILRMSFNVTFFKKYLFPVSEGFPALNVWLVYGSLLGTGLVAKSLLGELHSGIVLLIMCRRYMEIVWFWCCSRRVVCYLACVLPIQRTR
jgi:hypothetical protein